MKPTTKVRVTATPYGNVAANPNNAFTNTDTRNTPIVGDTQTKAQ
jgi:hypothetical protein